MNTPDIKSTETPALIRRLGLSRRQFMAASTGLAAASMAGPYWPHRPPQPATVSSCRGASAASSSTPCATPSRATRTRPTSPRASRRSSRSCRGSATSRSSSPATTSTPTPRAATSTTSPAPSCCARGSTTTASRPRATTARSRRRSPTPPSRHSTPQCEIANILGIRPHRHGQRPDRQRLRRRLGSSRPSGGTSSASARASHGLKLYTHNHDIAYSFLLDSGPLDALGRPTRSSGIRRLEYFLANTDPSYVYLEMDIYWAHVAQYKHRTYTAPDGTVVADIFDPLASSRRRRPGSRCSTPRTARSTPAHRQRLRDGAVRHRETSTTRRSSSASAPRATTTRCGSRTPHPAAPPTRASRSPSPQVAYDDMAALRG